jgi:hypothetical protein
MNDKHNGIYLYLILEGSLFICFIYHVVIIASRENLHYKILSCTCTLETVQMCVLLLPTAFILAALKCRQFLSRSMLHKKL